MVPTTVDIDADYGPLLLGGLLAFGLSGCVNMQFIVYWQIYSGERWTTKSLVIATWVLDLCHSAFVAVAIWDTIIFSYGDLRRMDTIPWSVGPTVELTAMVTFLVQSFFVYRIYRLQNRKFIVAGPVFVLAFIRLGAATVSMAEMILLKSYSDFVHPFPSWVFTLGLSLSAFVDIVITTSLCYFLRSNRSLVPRTNRMIDTLTLWMVQNGSITCLGAIASLICWLVMPQNRIFLGLHFVVGKLYANSLLATLNARHKIRSSQASPFGFLPDTPFTDQCITPRSEQPYAHARTKQMRLDAFTMQTVDLKRKRSIEVNIQRTVEAKYDNGEIDILSVTAESAREVELEPVPPDHVAEV
ncbi:hypothetical protein EV363DRAFT_1482559 [Boletus edulis]|nr:hypothetical protein EV363DRAFT_1482559 [Boletus edulis]